MEEHWTLCELFRSRRCDPSFYFDVSDDRRPVAREGLLDGRESTLPIMSCGRPAPHVSCLVEKFAWHISRESNFIVWFDFSWVCFFEF